MDPFNPEGNDQTPFNDDVVVDPNKDYWSEFVGEGKKYKDNSAAGRALAEKEAFIQRLQKETKGLRDELKTKSTFQDLMDRLEKTSKQPNQSTQKDDEVPELTDTLTPEKIEQLLEQTLQKRTSEATKQQNYQKVVDTLNERFGTNAQKVVADKATELGVGVNFLKDLAQDKPNVFLELVGQPKPQEPDLFAAPIPNQRQGTPVKGSQGVRNKSFYDNIKKQDSVRYWSPEVQNQMHNDAISQGVTFFNN